MDLKQFLTNNQIPHRKIWYYLRDTDGKKMPEGEKNNDTLEQILKDTNRRLAPKFNRYDKSTETTYDLSETEIESYKNAYSLYIKFTNYYCIDVDEIDINSMDDFIESTGCKLFKDSCWTTGNTKGIHIYIKINNMVEYSDEIDVFCNFKGDLIHKKQMWERIDKKMNNSEIETFEYENIKHLLNETINKTKILPESTIESNNNTSELEMYIKLAIKYDMFKTMKDNFTEWRNIGFIIKNDLGENGEDLFIEVCKVFEPEKFIESDSRNFYKLINKDIKQTGKKPLTIASLIKIFKDIDLKLAKKIIKEVKDCYKNENGLMIEDIDSMPLSTDTFPSEMLEFFNSDYCNSIQ